MASKIPPPEVQDAFIQGTSKLIRKVEIYEQDGKTPWRPELWPYLLESGSISCDYTRDEMRAVDLVLNNSDGDLNPRAGGFWYDKVLKPYFGIELISTDKPVSVAIVEDYGVTDSVASLRTMLSSVGIERTYYRPDAATLADVQEYDVLVSASIDHTRKQTLLNQAYALGKGIITFSTDTQAAELGNVIGGSAGAVVTYTGTRTLSVNQLVQTSLLGWSDWTLAGGGTYRQIITGKSDVTTVGMTTDPTNGASPGILAKENKGGQRWVHVQMNDFKPTAFNSAADQSRAAEFIGLAVQWVYNYNPDPEWIVQMGEFDIDQLADATEFRDLVKVTGRDYVKRCINAKLSKATMFRAVQPIEEIIKALAFNSGCTKADIAPTGITLGKDQTWERDTTRWDIMKEIAQANSQYLFFDNEGYLTMVPMEDPLLAPPKLSLSTGVGGNLVSRSARSVDSQLFNYITVVGEGANTSVPLVYAEAKNDNPGSPTSIQEIGIRIKNISSPLVTSELQAKQLAKQMLTVSMLEEFEVQFGSIMLPWIRPGNVIELVDESDLFWAPNKYLLTSLEFPLDLGPMSGTAKRITKF